MEKGQRTDGADLRENGILCLLSFNETMLSKELVRIKLYSDESSERNAVR